MPIAALGAGGDGAGFAPQRFTPAHGEAARLGAPFVEAGHWYRPSWFPAPGETAWQQSCDREVGWVRGAVGVCDVTTLGKIDVQGPDAAAFLDRVYANTISTLAVGRVRYGLMLREDGFVMDDGTVARLAPAQFLLTTTTAAAGEVMAHLEFCLQCLWPELDVQVVSVTEQWAQVAVAGPRSRELLNAVLAVPVDNASFPFMACGAAVVAGVAGRLFRISFSGEQAYEVAVPARYGAALFARLVERGARARRRALRARGAERAPDREGAPDPRRAARPDHRSTTSGSRGCWRRRRTASARPARRAPGSPGRSASSSSASGRSSAGGRLVAGAHVLAPGAAFTAENDEGYLTSRCFSPTLGHDIALGFVRDGRARIGERVRAVCKLRGLDVGCEIVPPVFVDPDGGRLRG